MVIVENAASRNYARLTMRMVRSLEPAGFLIQAIIILASAISDNYIPPRANILYALAALHVILVIVAYRHPGQLAANRGWGACWLLGTLIMPLVVAHCIAPATYGFSTYTLPLASYSWPVIVALAFYPRVYLERTATRQMFQSSFFLAIAVEPFLIVGQMNSWHYQGVNIASVATSAAWASVLFVTGVALGRLCETAANAEETAQRHDFHNTMNRLHDLIIKAEGGGRSAREILDSLTANIIDSRVTLLLGQENVFVSALYREAQRRYEGLFTEKHVTMGNVTIHDNRRAAQVVHRAFSELLKNVVEHGGGSADVRCEMRNRNIVVEIGDDGPGAEPNILENPRNSLHRLRHDIRELGGDLQLVPSAGGARFRLNVPTRGG